jgi:hypothetical protein
LFHQVPGVALYQADTCRISGPQESSWDLTIAH